MYRDLCLRHKTFRERSETAELAVEIRYVVEYRRACIHHRKLPVLTWYSLQPWRAYGTDGCILFSDILTPLPGMGVAFDILEKEGPKMTPMTTMKDVEMIRSLDPTISTPFVAEALRCLRKEVGNKSTVLGFVGLPYTIATYMIEGGSSTEFSRTESLAFQSPAILHAMLNRLAENIGDYALFQIENGAQVIQLFDSWAGHLSPADYDTFAAPYQRQVIEKIKKFHPSVPTILYINKSGALLERMANSGVDIVSLDSMVSVEEATRRMGSKVGIQGNLDPKVLFAPDEVIKTQTEDILLAGRGRRHIMNLGHGIDATTSEEKAKFFVDTVKNFRFTV